MFFFGFDNFFFVFYDFFWFFGFGEPAYFAYCGKLSGGGSVAVAVWVSER